MSLSVDPLSVPRYQRESMYSKAGIPDDIIAQGQTAIENYAFENKITLPDFSQTQDEEPLFEIEDGDPAQDVAAAEGAQTNGIGYNA